MTYSFDLHKEVAAGNIKINSTSRTMSTKKTGQKKKKRAACSDSDSNSEPVKVVKKLKGAVGMAPAAPADTAVKEAVAVKKMTAPRQDKAEGTMTITSFFSRKPPSVVGAPAPAASTAAASCASPAAAAASGAHDGVLVVEVRTQTLLSGA